eukprot:3574120-Prymnesium_polylepis.1
MPRSRLAISDLKREPSRNALRASAASLCLPRLPSKVSTMSAQYCMALNLLMESGSRPTFSPTYRQEATLCDTITSPSTTIGGAKVSATEAPKAEASLAISPLSLV